MKFRHIVFTLICYCSFSQIIFAQNPSPYDLQRQKVNALLKERSEKFGQYDKSLLTRSGIFGLQTKKDIKNSNEILRQIVLNDNAIFSELKVLLDYKDAVTQKIESDVTDKSDRIVLYQQTIKKLQDQNEILKIKLDKEDKTNAFKSFIIVTLLLSFTGLAIFYYRIYRKKITQAKSA